MELPKNVQSFAESPHYKISIGGAGGGERGRGAGGKAVLAKVYMYVYTASQQCADREGFQPL